MRLTCDTQEASMADSASSSLPVTTQRAPTSRPTACSTELAPPVKHQHQINKPPEPKQATRTVSDNFQRSCLEFAPLRVLSALAALDMQPRSAVAVCASGYVMPVLLCLLLLSKQANSCHSFRPINHSAGFTMQQDCHNRMCTSTPQSDG